MVLAVVQEKYAEVGFPGTIELDDPPTPGNLVVAWETWREQDLDDGDGPNGYTVHPDGACDAGSDTGRLSVRETQTGDDEFLRGLAPGSMVYAVEISGWDSYEFQPSVSDQTLDPIGYDIDMDGEGWAFAGILWRTPTDFASENIVPTGDTVELNDAKTGLGLVYHPLSWVAYVPADSDGTYQVTGDPSTALTHWWAGHALSIYVGGDLPEPPPVDPGYTPPDPGRAILEIYVHDEEATRWGTATWSADLIPTGTEGIWSGAGWQDVTPQGVTVHISWGSDQPERGILAIQKAQSWLVTTYDPDRILDPGNPDSPYAPELVTGVPIRLRNDATGRVVRTGFADRIEYSYRAPEYRGQIQASSSIAIAVRAKVEADSILGNDLQSRILDAHTASGITVGGVALVDSSDSYPAFPLSDQLVGERSLWEHIYRAAQEVGWVAFEDANGTFQVAPYLNPPDRGSTITYENLEDLTSSVSEDGQYSVVRVLEDDGVTVLERQNAPLPRYGRVIYDDRQGITTIDASGFADAVLADRAFPGVLWTPGTVWCFTAADVELMSGLQIMERVAIIVPGVLEVSGPLLGMELWVEQRSEERARWLFLPRIATTGTAAVGLSLLLADDDGSFLLSDDDGSYLEPDDA